MLKVSEKLIFQNTGKVCHGPLPLIWPFWAAQMTESVDITKQSKLYSKSLIRKGCWHSNRKSLGYDNRELHPNQKPPSFSKNGKVVIALKN